MRNENVNRSFSMGSFMSPRQLKELKAKIRRANAVHGRPNVTKERKE